MSDESMDGPTELEQLQRRLGRERATRRETEAIAERGMRALYEQQQQLQLLETIANAANLTSSDTDVLQFGLASVCEHTGWILGHVYRRDVFQSADLLQSTTIWYSSDPARFGEFKRASEGTSFSRGEGLPGRVLETCGPIWVTDVTTDAGFTRGPAAHAAKIASAFAFPALVGQEVVAVLEFFSEERQEPDEPLMRLLTHIGTQLGRVVERNRMADRLVHDASHDPLTGLPNRVLFLDRLKSAIARHRRHRDSHFAVLFIDLDRFKIVNDSLGHATGDKFLTHVSARLSASLRQEDVISRPNQNALTATDERTGDALARLGGDEFTILLEDLNDPSDAMRLAERIQDALKQPFVVDGHELYASASIGIASSNIMYASAEDVLRDADLAMYRAKASGESHCQAFDETMHAMAVERLNLETDLRRAVTHNEFVLHYQPVVSLPSAEITGFEALIRWQRGDKLVYPDKFIRVAEDTELIIPLGLWVLRTACTTMKQWQEQFPKTKPLTMSVNVSARQFAQATFVQDVRDVLADTGLDASTLRLEITESVTMGNVERTVAVLAQLKLLGVLISVDDFGTGFSSLAYLQRFPIDVLKIDRSFVSNMEGSDNRNIVHTIVNLASQLNMEVVAEGAETASDVAQLTSLGCGFSQGYYFSRPVAHAAATVLLERDRDR